MWCYGNSPPTSICDAHHDDDDEDTYIYDINDDCDDCDTGNLSSCDLISKVWVYKKQPNEATQMEKSGHTDHQM